MRSTTASKQNTTLGLAAVTVFSIALLSGVAGCRSNAQNGSVPNGSAPNGPDPAEANFAQVGGTASAAYPGQPARVLAARSEYQGAQATGESYPQQQQNESLRYNTQQPSSAQQPGYPAPDPNQAAPQGYDPAYDQSAIDAGQAALDEQALYSDQAPPPLPVYQQPELADEGDLWTPGYWSYGNGGYFWVPGAWVAPPYTGALWTPGWWGYEGRRYRFYHGYWGHHIGFYGGVAYGFGYTGYGYDGGYWNNNVFFYNRVANRINNNYVRNVYVHNISYTTNTRVSYNGPGGLNARPRANELAVLHEQRMPAMQTQRANVHAAESNRSQFFSANQGRPAMTVAAQHIAADRNTPGATRGGFGQQPGQQPNEQQRGLMNQQNRSNESPQLRNGQPGVQNGQAEQRQQEQQRFGQQGGAVQNQQIQQERDRNNQMQQQQQRNAQDQQRNVQQQQRNVQDQQQRNVQEQQQRTQQMQQQNRQQQPQQQRAPESQPQHIVSQPRSVEQQRPQVQQQAPANVQTPHNFAQPQRQQEIQPRAQPAPQAAPRVQEAPRPQPQQQHAQPAPAQHAAPASAPHAEGGHPR